MSLLHTIQRKMLENKFKRQHLNIIEDIPETQLNDIRTHFIQQGWELTEQKQSKRALINIQSWILRKGNSKLEFTYNSSEHGSICGLDRILKDIAKHQGLLSLKAPTDKTPCL